MPDSPLIGRYALVRMRPGGVYGEVEGRGHVVFVSDAGSPDVPTMVTLLEPDGTLSRWPHTDLVLPEDYPVMQASGDYSVTRTPESASTE